MTLTVHQSGLHHTDEEMTAFRNGRAGDTLANNRNGRIHAGYGMMKIRGEGVTMVKGVKAGR